MAQAKQKLKVIYHERFEGEGLGEAEAFYEIVNGKVEYVTGWFLNDAMWRDEYMSGLISHFGGEIERLPEKHHVAAAKLMCEAYGCEYEGDEEEAGEEVLLEYRAGTSDKVYNLSLTQDGEWNVTALYGRRSGNLKEEVKGRGLDYSDAKSIFDKVLSEKLKKGYKRK